MCYPYFGGKIELNGTLSAILFTVVAINCLKDLTMSGLTVSKISAVESVKKAFSALSESNYYIFKIF